MDLMEKEKHGYKDGGKDSFCQGGTKIPCHPLQDVGTIATVLLLIVFFLPSPIENLRHIGHLIHLMLTVKWYQPEA